MRNRQEPGPDAGVRMSVFAATVVLLPVLALVWVHVVLQEAARPGVTLTELLLRTAAVAGAGVLGYAVLRTAGAAAHALGRALDAFGRRFDG